MKTFVKEELTELAGFEAETCISIFIPSHISGVEVNEKQDAIRFKNNLQQARKILIEKGKDQLSVDQLLREGFELVDQKDFWNNQLKGLSVFISGGFFKIVKIPVPVKEELYVNSSFYIIPLLQLLTNDEHFFLIILSRKDANFYRGDAFGMEKVEVEGLPEGMDDVIHYEEKGGKQLMRRAGAAAGQGASEGTSFHGHGAGLADDTEYILQYLKEVDQTLWTEVLSQEKVPLMLAGTDYIIAHYRQISKYRNIAEESLTGNLEYEDKNALFQKAKQKLMPYFQEYTSKALKVYYDNSAKELTSSIPDDVIPASYYSKISDLFVQKDEHIWGHFDPLNNQLTVHEQLQEGDSCLINKAVVMTIHNGGAVHVLEKEKMPADSKLAAFMRY